MVAVVVTGAAGFIGGAVVRCLREQGRSVVALDRCPQRSSPGVRPLLADLTDPHPVIAAAVGRALASAEAVVHLAGCPGVRDRAPEVAARRQRDNVAATERVLAAVRPGTPVAIATSSAVYGGASGTPSREDQPLRPRGGYARSKAAAEEVCRRWLRRGHPVVVVRPFTVIGEGQRPDMALHRWVTAALQGRPLPVYGSPARSRDFTDVRDVARALVELTDLRVSGPVNVGTGAPHTLGQMLTAVAAVTGTAPQLHLEPAGPEDVPATWADPTRLERLLGWRPRTDLPDVVARVAAELRGGTYASPLPAAGALR